MTTLIEVKAFYLEKRDEIATMKLLVNELDMAPEEAMFSMKSWNTLNTPAKVSADPIMETIKAICAPPFISRETIDEFKILEAFASKFGLEQARAALKSTIDSL